MFSFSLPERSNVTKGNMWRIRSLWSQEQKVAHTRHLCSSGRWSLWGLGLVVHNSEGEKSCWILFNRTRNFILLIFKVWIIILFQSWATFLFIIPSQYTCFLHCRGILAMDECVECVASSKLMWSIIKYFLGYIWSSH